MKWIAFNPADFLKGTERLTPMQAGVYIKLMCLIYEREGAIPDDEKWIAGRLFISTRMWRKVRAELVAARKIYETVTGGGEAGLSNERCDIEIAESHRRIDKTAPPEPKPRRESKSVRNRFDLETETKPNEIKGEFRQHIHSTDSPPNPPPGDDVGEGIDKDLFRGWASYPRRGRGTHGPEAAADIWPLAAIRAGGVENLVEAVRKFAASEDTKRLSYLPVFHKWLAQGGYMSFVPIDAVRFRVVG